MVSSNFIFYITYTPFGFHLIMHFDSVPYLPFFHTRNAAGCWYRYHCTIVSFIRAVVPLIRLSFTCSRLFSAFTFFQSCSFSSLRLPSSNLDGGTLALELRLLDTQLLLFTYMVLLSLEQRLRSKQTIIIYTTCYYNNTRI
jgi:hypothetical protein